MPAALTALNVYPLKATRGTAVQSAELTPRGLRHDRELMLVDPDGRHLSQREEPHLALFHPRYDGTTLRITAPDGDELVHEVWRDGPRTRIRVHRSDAVGIDQGDLVAAWFSAALGRHCRLVRFPDNHVRPTDPAYGTGQVGYADGYPLLVTTQESLDELNDRLHRRDHPPPLPMNRFRPNLVLAGWPEPFTEDRVRRLRVGEVEVDLVKPCGRCEVTTIDQDTGERGKEPLFVLATFRRINRKLLFGVNAVPRVLGTVRVGDTVEVLEYEESSPAGAAR